MVEETKVAFAEVKAALEMINTTLSDGDDGAHE